jgi:uncharacterized protein (DUF305 family)
MSALMLGTVALAENKKQEHGGDPMTAELAQLSGADFEVGFLADMIHHHKSGIEMAKLAQQKTHRKEIKAMTGKMISAQTGEIEQMTGWLKSWHGKSPDDHPAPAPSKKKMDADMKRLEAAKEGEFDKLFLTMMSTHHQGAVNMSKLARDKAPHSETKALADKIAVSQSKEIQDMHQLMERL